MNAIRGLKVIALLVGMSVIGVAFAATYVGKSTIRVSGGIISGGGYTQSSVLATWMSTQCSLMVPGWGVAKDGPYVSATNTYGPVVGTAEVGQLYHRGERMYTTCTHRLTVNNVLQPVWRTQSNTITIP